MGRNVVLGLLFLLVSHHAIGQKISMKFGKTGNETSISNNENCSLGNFGTSGGFNTFDLIIENLDNSTDLIISNVVSTDDDSRIGVFSYLNSYTIKYGTPLKLYVSYTGNANISEGSESFSFTTNDPNLANVKLSFTANSDKGKLEVVSKDFPIVGNEINIGNVLVGTDVSNTFNLRNEGKGYMYINGTENVVSNNKLKSSFGSKELIPPSSSHNNNITFTAIKPGPIATSFTHRLDNAEQAKQSIRITGKVVAPVATWKHNGSVLSNMDEITLPVNDFTVERLHVNVTNTGDYTLNLGSMTLSNDQDSEFYIENKGGSNYVKPGESRDITIKYSPNKIGQKRIKFTAYSNGYQSSKIEFYINVKIQAAILTLSDEEGNEYDIHDPFLLGTSVEGAKLQKKLLLRNSGNKDLVISRIFEHTDYSFLNILNSPKLNLSPGETSFVDLEYTPRSDRRFDESATLRIVSNNQKNKDIYFQIKAKNAYSVISLYSDKKRQDNGSLYDFQATSVTAPKERDFRIENKGNRELDITNISLSDDANNYYTIVSRPAKTKLAPGESGTVRICFAPLKDGEHYYAKLKISSNDYQNTLYTLNLKGWATEATMELRDGITGNRIFNTDEKTYGPYNHLSEHKLKFQIKNSGLDKLVVSEFGLSATDGISASSNTDISGEYGSGQTAEFTIRLRPSTPGEKKVKVSYKTNDLTSADFSFTIKFMANVPVLQVFSHKQLSNKESVDFGEKTKQVFTLKNLGNKAFYIKRVAIEEDYGNHFSVNVSAPYVRASEQLSFDVLFSSTESGVKTAKLKIETDDATHPNFELNLSAEYKTTTGITGPAKGKLKLYPNPFSENLYIDLEEETPALVRIYNMNGLLVFQDNFKEQNIKLSPNLESGMYILELITDSYKSHNRIVVE